MFLNKISKCISTLLLCSSYTVNSADVDLEDFGSVLSNTDGYLHVCENQNDLDPLCIAYNGESTLSHNQWQTIQVFIHDSYELPHDQATVIDKFEMENLEWNDAFNGSLNLFLEIRERAETWDKTIYPRIIDLSTLVLAHSSRQKNLINGISDSMESMVSDVIYIVSSEERFKKIMRGRIDAAAIFRTYRTLNRKYKDHSTTADEEDLYFALDFPMLEHLTDIYLSIENALRVANDQADKADGIKVALDDFRASLDGVHGKSITEGKRLVDLRLIEDEEYQNIDEKVTKANQDLNDAESSLKHCDNHYYKMNETWQHFNEDLLTLGITKLIRHFDEQKKTRYCEKEYDNRIDEIKLDLSGLNDRKNHVESLIASFKLATESISDVQKDIEIVQPHFNTLAVSWKALAIQMKLLATDMDTALYNYDYENLDYAQGYMRGNSAFKTAMDNWELVRLKNAEFINNAYIVKRQ